MLRALLFQRSLFALVWAIVSTPLLILSVPVTTVVVAGYLGPLEAMDGQHFDKNGHLLVEQDHGSGVIARLAQVAKLERSATPVTITGVCASACTLYLTLPNSCTTRDALWMFHPLQAPPDAPLARLVSRIFGTNDPFADAITRISMDRFPQALALWQDQLVSRMGPYDEHWILGQDLLEAGWIRPCTAPSVYPSDQARLLRTRWSRGFVPITPLPKAPL